MSAYRGGPPREPGRCACNEPLERHVQEGVTMLQCARCGEQFVPVDAMVKIVASVSWQGAYLRDPLVSMDAAPLSVARPSACPTCAQPLIERKRYLGSRETVRTCADHGVWFEPGQLARVIRHRLSDDRGLGIDRSATRRLVLGVPYREVPILIAIAIGLIIVAFKECR